MLQKEDNDWMKRCMESEVQGARPRGRSKRTWRHVVQKTVKHVETGRRLWIELDAGS